MAFVLCMLPIYMHSGPIQNEQLIIFNYHPARLYLGLLSAHIHWKQDTHLDRHFAIRHGSPEPVFNVNRVVVETSISCCHVAIIHEDTWPHPL